MVLSKYLVDFRSMTECFGFIKVVGFKVSYIKDLVIEFRVCPLMKKLLVFNWLMRGL